MPFFSFQPLDGLLGTQATTPSGSSIPTSQSVAPPAPHVPAPHVPAPHVPASHVPAPHVPASHVPAPHVPAPHVPAPHVPAPHVPYSSSGKQSVPCIFFQKGLCLKGDRCAFLHGPNPTGNKIPQAPAATPGTEPPSLKKVFGGLEKCTQEQRVLQPNFSKSFEVPRPAKPATKTETAPPKHAVSIDKTAVPPAGLRDELPRYKATDVPPASNGNSANRSNRMHQSDVSDDHSFQNGGKDVDEFYRESSPGFDVLVDDDLRDSDYYHDEDQFGGDGRNLNSMNEFDIGRSSDYNSMADMDREMFRDPHGYDSYEHMHGQYPWDHRRSSSERMLVGAAPLERRGYRKSESPDQINESDLRHRLSKHRRVNGLRSVVSHDYDLDNHAEERSHRGPSRRDSHHVPTHESSLSSRLRGRIKLPRRSSPVNGSDLRVEKDLDRGRNWGRLSPGRQQISSQQGRLRDRIRGRVQEDSITDARNSWNQRIRRDIVDDGVADFAGPKSLAELKVVKNTESKEQRMKVQQSLSLGRQRNLKIEGQQQSEDDLSFEGPKPLSVILKRKRGAETAVSGSGMVHGNKEENDPEGKDGFMSSSKTTEVDVVGSVEDGLILTEKDQAADNESSQVPSMNELETEDGVIGDGVTEDQDHELEGFDQRDGDGDGDGEYEYEQGDEAEYNLEEGENVDPEEEYMDDEDGDDFAKKIGVMFS